MRIDIDLKICCICGVLGESSYESRKEWGTVWDHDRDYESCSDKPVCPHCAPTAVDEFNSDYCDRCKKVKQARSK